MAFSAFCEEVYRVQQPKQEVITMETITLCKVCQQVYTNLFIFCILFLFIVCVLLTPSHIPIARLF